MAALALAAGDVVGALTGRIRDNRLVFALAGERYPTLAEAEAGHARLVAEWKERRP